MRCRINLGACLEHILQVCVFILHETCFCPKVAPPNASILTNFGGNYADKREESNKKHIRKTTKKQNIYKYRRTNPYLHR